MRSASRGAARVHDVRRLRDMIRAAVQGGRYPDGHLPAEAELMAAHGASRGTVREALSLLRAEGLIERTQGIGTHAVVRPVDERLIAAHGATSPDERSLLNRRTRPWMLDRSEIPAPAAVADRLGVPAGTPCLRLEYVALYEEEPIWLATNYALFPEAGRLRDCPFVTDWYALMADAGVEFGQSEFVIGAEPADPLIGDILRIPVGAPVLVTEQTIADPAGRLFDLAFIHTRADRFRFVSRGLRLPGSEA
ncbi:GntR family transcriptional regulator [Amycolatopsis endophytica]|uniref:GntR family transcriptional regulator n=1 Tax=Amycolatopsis endophytica TaxID=860233 RepID=A0A853AWF3_9PSEU|nr:GntR family transcriptional regulator [Amycolatopsis endophytica]NYI87020.1 GntR family transcriptional regulator [Amycolatopsis endophytica]